MTLSQSVGCTGEDRAGMVGYGGKHGFTPDRSCLGNIIDWDKTKKRHAWDLEAHLLFIDLKMPYDSRLRIKMREVLQKTKYTL